MSRIACLFDTDPAEHNTNRIRRRLRKRLAQHKLKAVVLNGFPAVSESFSGFFIHVHCTVVRAIPPTCGSMLELYQQVREAVARGIPCLVYCTLTNNKCINRFWEVRQWLGCQNSKVPLLHISNDRWPSDAEETMVKFISECSGRKT